MAHRRRLVPAAIPARVGLDPVRAPVSIQFVSGTTIGTEGEGNLGVTVAAAMIWMEAAATVAGAQENNTQTIKRPELESRESAVEYRRKSMVLYSWRSKKFCKATHFSPTEMYTPNPDSQHPPGKHKNHCRYCKRRKTDAAEGSVGVEVFRSIVLSNPRASGKRHLPYRWVNLDANRIISEHSLRRRANATLCPRAGCEKKFGLPSFLTRHLKERRRGQGGIETNPREGGRIRG